MIHSKVTQVSRLYDLLCTLERDLGLSDYTEDERRIIYAIADLAPIGEEVPSRDIKEHDFCAPITAPTFYRALKRLSDSGVIRVPQGRKAGLYVLTRSLDPGAAPATEALDRPARQTH